MIYHETGRMALHLGDVREVLAELPAASVQTVITSPPYWGLRDYGEAGQIGLERTPAEYVQTMVDVFREVWRVLRNDGTLWLNLGDCFASTPPGNKTLGVSGASTLHGVDSERYRTTLSQSVQAKRNTVTGGLKAKDLVGIPWRVAFALQADGWYLRSDIVWSKPNPMPESVQDRPTRAHEYIFLLTKQERYFYDAAAIREGDQVYTRKAGGYKDDGWARPARDGLLTNKGGLADKDTTTVGRNKRSVWTVTTKPYPESHFATFPPDLIEPCVLAGSRMGDTILDPFNGAGTTGLVSLRHGRKYVGIDLNSDYLDMSIRRIERDAQANQMRMELPA